VCASQKLITPGIRHLILQALLVVSSFFSFSQDSCATSLEDAAASLAQKLCAPLPQKSLRVQWDGAPLLPNESFVSFKSSFLARLADCGVAVSENSADPVLIITLQVTVSKIVFVAEFADLAEGRGMRMVEIPRSTLSVLSGSSSSSRLRKELIWQQESPLSGAVEGSDESSHEHFLFLLGEGFLIRRQLENQVWKLVDSTELPSTSRPHRLGKGFFVYDDQMPARLAFLLDGKICSIQPGSRILFDCRPTALGGQVVTIASACDGKVQRLATGTGDYTQPDRITLAGQEVSHQPLSEDELRSGSIEMPGPVLDYLTNGDGKSVSAVVKNLSTGIYEVYRITTVCGQ